MQTGRRMHNKTSLICIIVLAACGTAATEQRTSAEGDALAVARISGVWEGETPDGVLRVSLCEDPEPLREVPTLHGSLQCPQVAHESRASRPAEPIDLEPAVSVDDFQGHTITCTRVMAVPLSAHVESWCTAQDFRGAMVLAAAPRDDLYAGDFPLEVRKPVAVPAGAYRSLQGRLTTGDVLVLEYATGMVCSARACSATATQPCVDGVVREVTFHRVTQGCP